MQDDIIEALIEQFRTLPGVGYKTASAMLFQSLRGNAKEQKDLQMHSFAQKKK